MIGRTRIILFSGLLFASGCTLPAIGALTVDQVFSVVSLGSTLLTGKGVGDHMLTGVTGEDCQVMGAVLNAERELCEPHGAPATKEDFRGIETIVALFEDEESRARPNQHPWRVHQTAAKFQPPTPSR